MPWHPGLVDDLLHALFESLREWEHLVGVLLRDDLLERCAHGCYCERVPCQSAPKPALISPVRQYSLHDPVRYILTDPERCHRDAARERFPNCYDVRVEPMSGCVTPYPATDCMRLIDNQKGPVLPCQFPKRIVIVGVR